MSVAYQYYAITLLVYFLVNTIACWAFNLQFGVGGLLNFAFILFQAVGAYIAGVLSVGPATGTVDNTWILGAHLPWPLPLVAATVAGALLALGIGLFALRPPRRDFQATIMLVVSIIAATLVAAESGWFNGTEGLYGVPHPLAGGLNLSTTGYGWVFVGLALVLSAAVYLFVDRITSSPWGRRLRAMRENSEAIESLGTNVQRESLKLYVIGGAIAAFSGGLFVEFIGAWSPGAWGIGETFVYMVAVIVGGLGNNAGAMLGSFLVLGVFLEVPEFLPQINYSNTDAAMQEALVGVLGLLFLWFRPRGILPERRRRLAAVAIREVGAAAALPTIASVTARARAAAAPGVAAAVEVHDLAREFGGVRAVDGISFVLPEGEITGLIGPNGAGKSTALKMIAGALAPTSGSVHVAGRDVTGWSQHRIARLGVVRTFQHTSEFARLTVLENLLVAAPGQPGDSFGGALLGRRHARARQRQLLADAYRLLQEFGLESHADSYAGELSGGQRRLVEIMRGLMAHPRVLLLDEPMAGVNPGLRPLIEDHLRRLADGGLTMLMVEHELGAVERVCDSVLVMAQGRLLASGAMGDLRRNEEVISAYLVG